MFENANHHWDSLAILESLFVILVGNGTIPCVTFLYFIPFTELNFCLKKDKVQRKPCINGHPYIPILM